MCLPMLYSSASGGLRTHCASGDALSLTEPLRTTVLLTALLEIGAGRVNRTPSSFEAVYKTAAIPLCETGSVSSS
jgi:hypothetical protein